jgi:hypothetical protein
MEGLFQLPEFANRINGSVPMLSFRAADQYESKTANAADICLGKAFVTRGNLRTYYVTSIDRAEKQLRRLVLFLGRAT